MSFTFGENRQPLDLSKGGDKLNNASPASPTEPVATQGSTPATKPVVAPLPPPPKVSLPERPSFTSPQPQNVPPFQAPQNPVYNQPVQPEPEPQYQQPVQQNTFQQQQEYVPQAPIQQIPDNSYPNHNQAQPVVQMVDRKGRPIQPKQGKTPKQPKRNAYAGSRSKVLLARVAVFGILGILILAGLNSFLPKTSGLTASDGPLIIQEVRSHLGVTDFPTTAGEGMALGFSRTYLEYVPSERGERFQELLQYAPESVIEEIDPRLANENELNSSATSGEEELSPEEEQQQNVEEEAAAESEGNTVAEEDLEANATEPGTQKVTDGPYLVRRVMVSGGENALYTTRTEVNNSTWIYMEIPMFWDRATNTLSVSGSPTFVKPILPANVPQGQFEPEWTNNTTIVAEVEDDIENYMRAWAASDTTVIERLTVRAPGGELLSTPEALSGLNGAFEFVRMSSLTVEDKPALTDESTASEREDYNFRQARVVVSWLEPSSDLVYTQTYELTLQFTNNDWFVQDIQNVGTSLGETRDRL